MFHPFFIENTEEDGNKKINELGEVMIHNRERPVYLQRQGRRGSWVM